MKKLLFIVTLLLLFLTGCGSKKMVALNEKQIISTDTYKIEKLQNNILSYKNHTAVIENCIEISENAMYSPVRVECCYSHIYTDVADLYPDSENIISGTVVDISYSDEDAVAATYCTVAVDEVLKGEEIESGSLVTVALSQGFCRVSKYAEVYGNDHFPDFDMSKGDTTYFVYAFDGEPLVQNGETFVLFLSPKLEHPAIDGGYFVPIGIFMGRYQLNEEGLYERYAPDTDFYAVTDTVTRSTKTEQPMTLDELREQILEAEELYHEN